MKFTPIPVLLALLVPAIAALPAGESVDLETQSPNQNEVEALVCADNLCVGINKNKLCNDRVSERQRCFDMDDANIWTYSAGLAPVPADNTSVESVVASSGSKWQT